RAETVVTYLGLFGIDAGRLVPKGYGESKPVEPNTTEEGRAKNRRVELVK
ncbi:MAG: OmpA family protein, partial [Deltaproteobacteria bacterium]|nr:OmpA family protein [Deltaproteobacteria bacterium]